MVTVPTTPDDIRWLVLSAAKPCLDQVRSSMAREDYDADRRALREFLCGYFNTGACAHKQGRAISPMRSTLTDAGGKCLKVRWGVPGGGKSGGLRLAVVVYCRERCVKLCGAWKRIDDPSDVEFADAVRGA